MGIDSAALPARGRGMGQRRPGDALDAGAADGLLEGLSKQQSAAGKVPACLVAGGDGGDLGRALGISGTTTRAVSRAVARAGGSGR